ncbi:hypothetical protein CWI66_15910 [Halomonas sp. 141]|nr:hypothetical protein CWI66_15910 [Halomonas sp. 141]
MRDSSVSIMAACVASAIQYDGSMVSALIEVYVATTVITLGSDPPRNGEACSIAPVARSLYGL